jgi:GTP-binding protein
LKVLEAEFVASAASAETVPHDGLPHVAFVGRSNVGKSTLINALTHSKLARTSAKPGKTRLLNLYRLRLASKFRVDFVDLPGYGYAAGRTTEEDFDALAGAYFAGRRHADQPTVMLLLVDGRHPGLRRDLAAWSWLVEQGLPAAVVITKIDKLTRADRSRHLGQFTDMFNIPLVAVSALSGEGLEDLWTTITKQLRP